MNAGVFDDLASPLDQQLMKKKNEKFPFNDDNQIAKSGKQSKSSFGGLRINTNGLSLASNIKACNEGMSPLMERFQRNKKKNPTNKPAALQ